jgi:hypothetical protein
MRDSPGNGNPPERYALSRSDNYLAARKRIEADYPLVRQIRLFDYVEACLRLFPPHENAERVTQTTWVLVTQPGVNVPEIDFFFTFEDGEVCLRDAFAA